MLVSSMPSLRTPRMSSRARGWPTKCVMRVRFACRRSAAWLRPGAPVVRGTGSSPTPQAARRSPILRGPRPRPSGWSCRSPGSRHKTQRAGEQRRNANSPSSPYPKTSPQPCGRADKPLTRLAHLPPGIDCDCPLRMSPATPNDEGRSGHGGRGLKLRFKARYCATVRSCPSAMAGAD